MKSIKFVSAVAMAAGILVMGSAQASDGGTLTITGRVDDQTCTIRGGAGTDEGTGNIAVALEPVAAASLTKLGDQANHKPFNLVIGGPGQGSCEDGKVARLTFRTGDSVDPVTGTLRNTIGVGGASNTNVQLTKGTATDTIDLNNPAEYIDSPVIAGNTANLRMGAQYYATGAATSGPVNTRVQYEVNYN
ncbi:fimbrial protein [Ralstonia sp. 24A2]|uniref:fimbrial protein n=1 Tax=Ralstonia sp. 24A2 TaxID=3447364 RepID=UPI003F6A0CF4